MALTLPNGTAIPDIERQRCEIWCRVMGYYRPVSEFNIGKQQEFIDRKFFDGNQHNKEELKDALRDERRESERLLTSVHSNSDERKEWHNEKASCE